jgi:hypothetical protein
VALFKGSGSATLGTPVVQQSPPPGTAIQVLDRSVVLKVTAEGGSTARRVKQRAKGVKSAAIEAKATGKSTMEDIEQEIQ